MPALCYFLGTHRETKRKMETHLLNVAYSSNRYCIFEYDYFIMD